MCLATRPEFPDREKYLQHVRDSRLARLRYWEPATVDELLALSSEMPDVYAEFRPSDFDLRMIVKSCRVWSMIEGNEHFAEVADGLEHGPLPLTEREQERLLVTLATDVDFRAAFRTVLNERGAV